MIGRPPPLSGYGGRTPPLPTDAPREHKVVALEPREVVPPLTEGGGGEGGATYVGRGTHPPLARVHGTVRLDGGPLETMGGMEELRGYPLPLLSGEGAGVWPSGKEEGSGGPLFL